MPEMRKRFNFYLPRYVYPWMKEFIAPWRVTLTRHYLRDNMAYWVER